jgi:alpha-glucosidase
MPLRRWLGGEDRAGHDNQPYADTHHLATDAMAQQWRRFMGAIAYPIALQQFNQLDSHDTTRFLYIVDEDKALLKLGAALMFGFPGVPCVYYGDEIGMGGFKDPFNRRCMPWDESAWDTELQDYFRRLIDIRKASPALREGGFQVLHAADDTIACLREAPEQTMLIIGYRGDEVLASLRLSATAAGLPDGTLLSDMLSERAVTVQNGAIELTQLAHGDALFLDVQT